MSLKGVSQQTLQILDEGRYRHDGGLVFIRDDLHRAVEGTKTWTPEQLVTLSPPQRGLDTRTTVTDERTQQAAHRLVVVDGVPDLVLLNFASARNVCGGFTNGARAQEEDLARCSGLYACLNTQLSAYYAPNRAETTLLYTDHLVYSPRVPFFRQKNRDLLAKPYLASVITAPAPNAGQALRRDPGIGPLLDAALVRRAGYVLALAAEKGHENLLLGAWGCGVFQNPPQRVAQVFHDLLSTTFRGVFRQVVFGVYDPGKRQKTLGAFQRVLSPK